MDELKRKNFKEDIKSKYNIQQIFSFLNKKQILKMIIYNKHLKEILNIIIQDYIEASKKFKIGEKNGKGKEYGIYTNQILYIGEYLNGKRNGKGKEYGYYDERRNKSLLIFQGEYLNGKRNGKGIEYEGDTLRFEGEYLNGERNGKGKEYYNNGDLKFEGEYLNEKIWNGKIYNPQGVVECEIKEGKGYIKEYTYSGNFLLYEGEYLNGERNGKGKEYFIYFDHDSYSLISKLEFEGEYKNGKKWNGKGKEYEFSKGRVEFDGEYLNGEKWNGKVRKYCNCYLDFEGELLNGKIIKGKEYICNDLYFEGEYLNDKKWNGKIYNEEGKILCEIKEGKGYIKEYNNDFLEFEGEYLNGERNGKVEKEKNIIVEKVN